MVLFKMGRVLSLLLLLITTSVSLQSPPPPNVIIVGGSSGMGKAAAMEVLRHGGKCLLVSRSEEKLNAAKTALLNELNMATATTTAAAAASIETAVLDATDESAVRQFASDCLDNDCWDGLVVTAAGKAPHGPFLEMDTSHSRDMLETKFWTAYHCAKYVAPKLRDGGSVVFTTGILGRRPGVNCVPLAITNGALEALTRSLALEWGPRLRCNCLCPGFCDTERFDHMTVEQKEQMVANTAASLPLQRIGRPQDMGQAIYFLLTSQFTIGVVLDVDGGHMIRQYALTSNDPMRATK